MTLKLGKKPARHGVFTARFSDFFDTTKLPQPPATFGHWALVKNWKMLANDRVGDCVFAGAAHEAMSVHKEIDDAGMFDDDSVLADYAAVTGYDGSPESDQGTDMGEAAIYRRTVGIREARSDKRHKIDTAVAVRLGDWDRMKQIMWLTGFIGIGIRFPDFAERQFEEGKPWDVEPDGQVMGGHYIPGFGIELGNGPHDHGKEYLIVVTWGKVQRMTKEFYLEYTDEVIAYLDLARLKKDTRMTAEGFDEAKLRSYLDALT